MIQIDLTGAARFAAFFSGARVNIDASLDAMEMTGWRGLPARFTAEVSARLRAAAGRVAETSDAFVVVGAGGSSLGARALTDALPDASDAAPQLFFTGDNLSGAHLSRLLNTLRKLDFSISVVSKSGGTLETMMAARALLALLREKYGARAYERVYITAGERDNPLRRFALERGCALFEIPESVGGRYSVLTAAGLLPAAVRGLDLDAIISGAREEAERGADTAFAYASTRRALYAAGYTTEILASFEPDAARVGDWWRQLFGESEGKGGGGIFPSRALYTADLHAMGQYVQQGRRDLFETVLTFADTAAIPFPPDSGIADGLDRLTGRSLGEVNAIAKDAVVAAHISGGVPVLEIEAARLDEAGLGALLYFFELSCAYSGILGGVNPFDQPGVEAYKKNMRDKLQNNG